MVVLDKSEIYIFENTSIRTKGLIKENTMDLLLSGTLTHQLFYGFCLVKRYNKTIQVKLFFPWLLFYMPILTAILIILQILEQKHRIYIYIYICMSKLINIKTSLNIHYNTHF